MCPSSLALLDGPKCFFSNVTAAQHLPFWMKLYKFETSVLTVLSREPTTLRTANALVVLESPYVISMLDC